MTSAQGRHYEDGFDYHVGSPHLRHPELRNALTRQALHTLLASGLEPERQVILDIGAGEGSFSEILLSHGFSVVATEISAASAARLEHRFKAQANFEIHHDPHGNLSAIKGRPFNGVLFASVLHHIPDYLSAIERVVSNHLRTGGAFVSIQDPLWYPRLGRANRLASELSYLSWRVSQGNIREGFLNKLRRFRGGAGETHEADLVEYHVVRNGVDEEGIGRFLELNFAHSRIETYWSSQGIVQQQLGNALGFRNTFSLFATGYLAGDPSASSGHRQA